MDSYRTEQETLQEIYSKLKPGKRNLAVVDIGWNNRLAGHLYHLVGFNSTNNSWSYMAEGNRDWAKRIASHYELILKVKVQ